MDQTGMLKKHSKSFFLFTIIFDSIPRYNAHTQAHYAFPYSHSPMRQCEFDTTRVNITML